VSLFVDSSVWYAAADRGEKSNARCKAILSAGERLVTSDHVLLETWFLVNRRLGREAAERTWKALREVCALECVVPADIDRAWDIGEAFPDQTFSLVDRTCFAMMRRLGITRAASLDDHFAVFRFGPRRDRAFEIVR
jgi:uncharacterized protein